jgi:hypothetical protein
LSVAGSLKKASYLIYIHVVHLYFSGVNIIEHFLFDTLCLMQFFLKSQLKTIRRYSCHYKPFLWFYIIYACYGSLSLSLSMLLLGSSARASQFESEWQHGIISYIPQTYNEFNSLFLFLAFIRWKINFKMSNRFFLRRSSQFFSKDILSVYNSSLASNLITVTLPKCLLTIFRILCSIDLFMFLYHNI